MSIPARRHNTRRIKAKFTRLQKMGVMSWGNTAKSAGIFANHGSTCSASCCGNHRRSNADLTLQEKRANITLLEINED